MKRIGFAGLIFVVLLLSAQAVSAAVKPGEVAQPAPAVLLASGLEGASGSAIGPGGFLYVTEPGAGQIWRVDPQTGARTLFARGLPKPTIGLGGAMDVAFIGNTAYVLVTLVGPEPSFLGGNAGDVVGIYRLDGPDSFTVVADIGKFSVANPPHTDFVINTGLQYAMDRFRDGFVVTDGHHNRVLWVTLDGEITEMMAFDDIVPTGLAVSGNTVYMAEAGPNPHLPADGKVVSFGPTSASATAVASGAPLLVDVEFGRGRTLYALAQGDFPVGSDDGSPALPNTGSLVAVNANGGFTVITDGLNQPTSVEFIGNTAYVITLTGEVWKIKNVSEPPFGESQTPLAAAVVKQSQLAPVTTASNAGQDCPWGYPVYDMTSHAFVSQCSNSTISAPAKPMGLAKPAPVDKLVPSTVGLAQPIMALTEPWNGMPDRFAVAHPAAPMAEQTIFQGTWESSEIPTFIPAPPPDAETMLVDGEASGNATYLGKYNATYKATVDVAGCGCSEGDTVHFVAANGDSLDGTGWGNGRAIDGVPGFNLVTQTYTVTGGTGRFAGATGYFVVLRMANLATGESTGSLTGAIVLR